MNTLSQTQIKKFLFSHEGAEALLNIKKGRDWPVVYILTGVSDEKNVAYIGETSSAYNRMIQHLANPERKCMKSTYIIFNDMFNKSAVLDVENMLIEHMHVDGSFTLQNLNGGQSRYHDYYQRLIYRDIFCEIWSKLRKEHIAGKTLSEVENSNLFKYSPFKQLTDEQYDLRNRLLLDIATGLDSKEKKQIIVEGGAGTGKSVLAVSLLKYIADVYYTKRDFGSYVSVGQIFSDSSDYPDMNVSLEFEVNRVLSDAGELHIAFVIPMDSFRKTIKAVFSGIKSLKKLNVDVVGPNEFAKKEGGYDIVIVDEAHRLQTYRRFPNHAAYKASCRKLGFSDFMNTTQLDWVVRQTRSVLIMFYDRNQTISDKDIFFADIEDLKRQGAIEYIISNQIRLLAGKDYIDYWMKLLRNDSDGLIIDFSKNGYDFRIYDRFEDMLSDIAKRDRENNGLCRVLSGYGFRCSQGKNDSRSQKDIVIEGKSYYWNDKKDFDYVNNSQSVYDIGCVHKVQGFDLNYAGVVFAPDIRYKEGKGIIPVPENYYDTTSKSSYAGRTEKNILNSYLVLLTRGIKGTYIYCCDSGLKEYFIKKFGMKYVRYACES